jgi:hypothetical protein
MLGALPAKPNGRIFAKSLQCTKCGPLAHPRFDREFIFACDGCQCPGDVGGCLEQRQDDGTIRPEGCASRALTATQLKWDVSRIEAWCIVFLLRYFYWASNPKFKHIIITDHVALKWMDTMLSITPFATASLCDFRWRSTNLAHMC